MAVRVAVLLPRSVAQLLLIQLCRQQRLQAVWQRRPAATRHQGGTATPRQRRTAACAAEAGTSTGAAHAANKAAARASSTASPAGQQRRAHRARLLLLVHCTAQQHQHDNRQGRQAAECTAGQLWLCSTTSRGHRSTDEQQLRRAQPAAVTDCSRHRRAAAAAAVANTQ